MKAKLQTWVENRRAPLRVDLAGGSIVAALTLAAYLAVIAPARDARMMAATNATRLAGEQSRIAQLSGTLSALHTQREAAIRLSSGTLPQFASIDDLNGRLAKLTDLAASVNVQIDAMAPDANPLLTPMFAVIKITINARGSDESCQQLVGALHEKMRDMIVTSMELASPAPGDPTSLNLQLMWYASPTPAPGAH